VFVGIEEIDRIVPVLKKYFSDDTPACIAFKAGFSKSGRLVPTTLGELKNAAERDTEKSSASSMSAGL
jgi:precorrin-4 methylase